MITLVLDTNIFRRHPSLSDQAVSVIEKLSSLNFLRIYVPFTIEREFLTQQNAAVSEQVDALTRALGKLSKRTLPNELKDWLLTVKAQFAQRRDAIFAAEEHRLTEWISKVKGIRMPLCLEQAAGALTAYFDGTPPFKQPKTREDLPDSFIYQAIRKLAANTGAVVMVSDDKRLREAVAEIVGVSVFCSLEDLIQSRLVQDVLMAEEHKAKQLEQLFALKLKLSEDKAVQCLLANAITAQVGEAVMWKAVGYSDDPDNWCDSDDSTIQYYEEAGTPSLIWEGIIYYGDGCFGLPFKVTVTVLVFYYISKHDYWLIEDWENGPQVRDHNDYVFEARRTTKVSVEGILAFSVYDDFDLNDGTEMDCVDEQSIEIETITSISELISSSKGCEIGD